MAEKVRAIMIVEMAGRPPEHLKKTLTDYVENMRNLNQTKIFSIEISDAKRLESENEMYTCFAEIELETETLQRLIEIVFDYMPSSVEVLEPANLDFNNQNATVFLNDLAGRLHRYDEVAKMAQLQNYQLAQKLQMMQQEVMKKDAGKTKKKPAKKSKASKKSSKKVKKVSKKK